MIREKRKKQKRKKHFLLSFFMFLCVLAGLALFAFKGFRLKTVEVEGNELYSEETIKETLLSDKYSWNSLYVFMKYTFAKPKDIPFVDTVEVSLKGLHKIHIQVYEKGMMGYVYIPSIEENAYFDKDGFVVETSSRVIEDIPRIDGISCDKVVLYEKLPIDASKRKTILTITQSLKRENLVPEVITFNENMNATLKYGTIVVELGSTDSLTKKIMHMSKILPQLENESGTLHLEDWTEETTNIVFERQE